MDQSRLLCLSVAPNLRCVGFTLGQLAALLIPLAIEVIISFLFIYLYSGPSRRAQVLLVVDGVLYFIWALLDMLSYIFPAVRTSLFIGAVSFTPIFIYAIYLYRLSFGYFIPTLSRKLQPYLEISLPILSVTAIALNEVSSFVGAHPVGSSSNQPSVVVFSNNSEFMWLSLSRSSLAIYAIVQFLFFLLAFFYLCRASLDRKRMGLTHSDEYRYPHGAIWITIGIIVGVAETVAGFFQVSFGLALGRRILRLIARATLMFGLLKGLDVTENVEGITYDLRNKSWARKHVFRLLGFNPQQTRMYRSISRLSSEQVDECSSAGKQSRERRVTVHHEKGHAPLLQIRFSTLEFPADTISTDMVHQGPPSQLNPGLANGDSSAQQHRKNFSDDMNTTQIVIPETPKAKSAPNDHVSPDWFRPPIMSHTRQRNRGSISDSLSIVVDLEREFPNLPPRVTGKHRGPVLGQNYEEGSFPVVARNPSEESGASATLLRSNSSIKRKPAPPLDNIAYISDQRKHPESARGGLIQSTVNHSMDFPAVSDSSWEGSAIYSADPTLAGKFSTSRLRKTTRNVLKRASRALSDASIRSAEWVASAKVPQTIRTPLTALTAADIEMYRRGDLGPGSVRLTPGASEASLSGDRPLPGTSRRSADGTRVHS